ncbi:ABC transporter ATP-binding protein [Acholeplasma hippikon]|uniref:ABC-type multidrug/protein/lipid transport system ATPase component n=1 Tax=Acholeplasma hippikon TaxID=264636 RepID=A0A449BKJ2_9MOLU|nr:ABC transporter ATP-binding protein [Acholeplasma hippikon]VEU82857.1 ABC-type multidrug/protein/lipid transport system ATPase component [Acholeplasma hippikon]
MQHNEEDIKLKKISLPVWGKLIKVIFKSKKNLIIMTAFAVSLAVLDSVNLILNKYVLDEFVGNNNFEYFTPFIIINILYALIFGLCVYGFIYQGGIIEANVSYDLRKQAFKTLQRLPFSYYDKTPQGWIMARMTSDARRLSQVISWGIIDFVWSILLMIITLIILYVYNWRLAIVVSIGLPFMFMITTYFRKKVLIKQREARHFNSELTAKYNESFHGARTSKTLGIEQSNLMEFDATAEKMMRTSIKATSISSIYSSCLLMACYLIVSVVMITGTFFVREQMIVVGTLYLFIRSTISFFDPMTVLTSFISSLQVAQASAERIIELIETESEIIDSPEVVEKYGDWFNKKKENWEPLHGDIEFKDVTFYYNENEIILDNFNLKIKRGMSVALVGHTGSGKTTIVNLTSRFYEPKKGQILIDGRDYKERSISWLHERLGYVLQSPQLFSTTVMENIRYGRLDATDEEVIAASKAIGLHTFIEKLDKGYDTHVGEGGNLLSLGQKQLISFARAILANPSILILDEATSSIDSEAEYLIQQATKSLLKNRTSLIVAHRLSTIVDSDLIVLLDGGKILEQGTHHELLEKRGAYFELYKNQFLAEKDNLYVQEMQKL